MNMCDTAFANFITSIYFYSMLGYSLKNEFCVSISTSKKLAPLASVLSRARRMCSMQNEYRKRPDKFGSPFVGRYLSAVTSFSESRKL